MENDNHKPQPASPESDITALRNQLGNNNNRNLHTNLSAGAALGFFLCVFVLMFIVVSFVTSFLLTRMHNMVGALRIATLIQDIFLFIIPAVGTAMIMTRLPATFLSINLGPRLWPLLIAIATLFAAEPAMALVIKWNAGLQLPTSMSGLETALREAEKSAEEFFRNMMGAPTVGSLLVSIAIVAVLAGLSEELFFRGAMQRLFMLSRMNHHVAIWIVAIIFSLFHFQFFGFVPRMLLGAYFGYLVWWSKCLWIPIIVHIVNNSWVIIMQWSVLRRGVPVADITGSAVDVSPQLAMLSVLLAAGGIYLFITNTSRFR